MKRNKIIFFLLLCSSALFGNLPGVVPAQEIASEAEVIDTKGLKQLEFGAVIEALDSTYTSLGTARLKALTRPTTNKAEIIQRQAVIASLEKGGLTTDTRAVLSKIRIHEESVIRYSSKFNELFHKVGGFYYTWLLRKANKNAYALSLSYWGKLLGTSGLGFCLTSSAYLANHFTDSIFATGPTRGALSWIKKALWPGDIIKGFSRTRHQLGTNEQINAHAQSLEKCKSLFESSDTTAGDRVNALLVAAARSHGVAIPQDDKTNIIQAFKEAQPYQYRAYASLAEGQANFEPAAKLLFVAGLALGASSSAYADIKSEHELWTHVNELCSWIVSVRQLSDQLQSIDVQWEQKYRLQQLINDRAVSELFEAADAFYNSWGRTSRWLHNPGTVLQIHHLAKKAAPLLEHIRHAVGEIDAFVSVAHVKKRLGMCFVEFVDTACTTITGEGLWSLIIPKVKAITNNVDLGFTSANKMMVTGPNGGGKSTLMKLLGQIFVLAQSWGIGPAQFLQLSIVDRIITAIDPQQSIKADLSTFMHELVQIKETVALLNSCQARDERCLVLIDEPCRGTIELEASQRVTKLCAELDACTRAAVILATHLYDPALAVQDMSGWSSWQLGYAFEGNDVRRTFELLPGTAHWWFTDAVKRSQFLHSLETGISSH